ncbi:MAG TPA: extracellular solute-binding protein [Acidimicrobiales bacterium]|nr:extracellular solute-binding protein [Acidimicrobiales bacterium]
MLTTRRTRCGTLAFAALVGATAGAVALPAGASAARSGPVSVYYAASLQDIMEQHVGPRFEQATGYGFTGFSGASGTLANEIKGGIARGDVFVSANAATNNILEGARNGNWVSWYLAIANSPLVLGYNPHGAFAAALKSEPWFKVVTRPGFRIGRTDPAVDPKGKLTVQAITAAVQVYGSTALNAITTTSSDVYPEASLVGELQSGQLDAGFFYASEAKGAGIPVVKLGKLFLAATYTVSVLRNAPDEKGAEAFVKYLLSKPGVALMRKEGLTVVKPRLIGPLASVPRSLRHLIPTP